MMVMVILELVCPIVANFSSPSLLAKGHKTDPMFVLKSIPLVRMISHSDWFCTPSFWTNPFLTLPWQATLAKLKTSRQELSGA
jgi:hypothetical protein